MIDLAIKSTLIFSVAALVNAVLRRASAAQRHAIWMAAFAAVPLVALLSRFVKGPVSVIAVTAVEAAARQSAPAAASYVNMLWAAGSALLLLRLAVSFLRLHAGRDNVEVPLTFGVFRPEILLPRSAATWLPDLRISVLRHEQAHIRRGDTASQLFTQIVCALIWFQPLAWYAASRAAEERERACDDLVLHTGIAPADYASHLVEIASLPATGTAAGIAMASRSSIENRVHAILSRTTPRAEVNRRYSFTLLAAAACLVSGIAVVTAQDQRVYKITDPGIVAPKLIHKVEPEYTEQAKSAGISGSVSLSMEINRDGVAQNIRVVRALEPSLDQNAIAALSAWRFRPATKDGAPVTVAAKVEVNFRLQ